MATGSRFCDASSTTLIARAPLRVSCEVRGDGDGAPGEGDPGQSGAKEVRERRGGLLGYAVRSGEDRGVERGEVARHDHEVESVGECPDVSGARRIEWLHRLPSVEGDRARCTERGEGTHGDCGEAAFELGAHDP